MFSPFERMVAGRYLRARKQEGFVSVIAGFSFLGIMLGVATLIIVMSVMNGFREELVTRILGLNGHINVYSQNAPLTDYNILSMKLEDVDGVVSVFPVIDGQALLSANGNSSGVMVRGYSLKDFWRKPVLADSVIRGGKIGSFGGTKVAIGTEMAERMYLRVGDKITLIAPRGKTSPFGTIPRSRQYEVGIIFDVGMYEYNNGFVFISLAAAQKFFQMPGAVKSLEIMTEDPTDIDNIRKSVAVIAEGRAGVYDWRDMNNSFFNALQVERNVMFLILTLIIIVAAFNIISSMIMLVKDKGQDIAILRTMGATSKSMMKIFMLTGASIGLLGTFAGAVLGIAFAQNIEAIRQWLEGMTGTDLFAAEIYFLSQLPAVINRGEVGTVIVMSLFLSILATIYPAWRAARLDPVEALRYE